MLYVGFPVSYETTCSLFGLLIDTDNLEKIIKNKGFDFRYTDKGQYILGLEVKEVKCLWENFVSVDNALVLILEQKNKLLQLIKKEGLDLSNLLIQPMDTDEQILVHNPSPYLITF
jgi:hypothetical protein